MEKGIFLALIFTLYIGDVAATENGWHPSPLEIAKLPKYCQDQFNGIPDPIKNCGPGMNHLCPGLVQLKRAQNPLLKKSDRQQLLHSAKGEFQYTDRYIDATCPLKSDFDAAKSQVRLLEQLLR